MKRVITIFVSIMIFTMLPSFAKAADMTAQSLVCLDREYTFKDGTEYKSVVSGLDHVALIRPDNSLWMFGDNTKGQLGIGESRNSYNAPIKIMEDVKAVKTKRYTTTVIKNDGSMWGFGNLISYTPKKLADNVIDADSTNGYIAYIDSKGIVYIEPSRGGEKQKIAESGKEVYIFLNSQLCSGFVTCNKRTGSFSEIKELYGKVPDLFVLVRHNDDSVIQYNVKIDGSVTSEKAADGAVNMTVYDGANACPRICITLKNGNIIYGDLENGLKTTTESDTVYAINTLFGLCVLRSNGDVYNVTKNTLIANNIKMFAPVCDTACFTINKDNVAEMHGEEDIKALFEVSNYSIPISTNVGFYEDIYAKTMEIVAGETDKYIQAKLISEWISSHVKYEISVHDQSGVEAFRQGTGVCEAYAQLTSIMFGYLDIPVSVEHGHNHAWNHALIDGVVIIIDNTGGMFDISYNQAATSNYFNICDSWAIDEIRAANDYELVSSGLLANTRINIPISRYGFCNLVCRILERYRGKSIDSIVFDMGRADISVNFTDTNNNEVSALCRLGIINGRSDTIFAPSSNITRQEAAKIMRNLAIALDKDVSAPSSDFADKSKIADWATDGVNFVSHNGIMNGRGNGFDPLNAISIQESILVCYRYFDSIN